MRTAVAISTTHEADAPSRVHTDTWPHRLRLVHAVAAGVALVVSGAFALVLRLELVTPGRTLVDGAVFRQLALLGDAWLVLGVALPALALSATLFLADDLVATRALPSLMTGSVLHGLALCALVLASVAAGSSWTVACVALALGVALIAGTWQAHAVVVATRPRPRIQRMPLGGKMLRVAARAQRIALPLLAVALVVRGAGHHPQAVDHLVRILLQPILALGVLAALAAIALAVAPEGRAPGLVAGAAGLVLVGGALWIVRLTVGGIPGEVIGACFALLLAVPLVLLLRGYALLLGGAARDRATWLAFFALLLFACAAVTGIHAGFPRLALADTAFASARAGYLAAALVFACLAALARVWPSLFAAPTLVFAGVAFGALQLALVPQLLAGVRGLPAVIDSYPAQFQVYEIVTAVGASLLATTVAWFFWTVVSSLRQVNRG